MNRNIYLIRLIFHLIFPLNKSTDTMLHSIVLTSLTFFFFSILLPGFVDIEIDCKCNLWGRCFKLASSPHPSDPCHLPDLHCFSIDGCWNRSWRMAASSSLYGDVGIDRVNLAIFQFPVKKSCLPFLDFVEKLCRWRNLPGLSSTTSTRNF